MYISFVFQAVKVLTNLQRGNVQTEESVLLPQQMSWHTRAGMGEITAQHILQAQQTGVCVCVTRGFYLLITMALVVSSWVFLKIGCETLSPFL